MNYILTITTPTAEAVPIRICVEFEMPVSVVFYGWGTAIKKMLDLMGKNRMKGALL